MNRKERALKQINAATEWVIGGYQNSLSNNEIHEMPDKQEVIYEIYETIFNNGSMIIAPMPDLKFCGKDWLIKQIKKRVEETPEYKIAS